MTPVVRILYKHGANPLRKDVSGNNALDWCIGSENYNHECYELLKKMTDAVKISRENIPLQSAGDNRVSDQHDYVSRSISVQI